MGSYTDTKISKEMIHMRAHIVPQTHKMSSVFLAKKRTLLYGCCPSNSKKFLCAPEQTIFLQAWISGHFTLFQRRKKIPQTRAMNCPYPTDILCAIVARQITFCNILKIIKLKIDSRIFFELNQFQNRKENLKRIEMNFAFWRKSHHFKSIFWTCDFLYFPLFAFSMQKFSFL